MREYYDLPEWLIEEYRNSSIVHSIINHGYKNNKTYTEILEELLKMHLVLCSNFAKESEVKQMLNPIPPIIIKKEDLDDYLL